MYDTSTPVTISSSLIPDSLKEPASILASLNIATGKASGLSTINRILPPELDIIPLNVEANAESIEYPSV